MAANHKSGRRVWWTSDIETAAYLMHRGLENVTARRQGRNGRFDIGLLDPEGRADDLADEFLNSGEFNYAQKLRALRKRLLDRKRNGGDQGGAHADHRA